MFWILLFFGLVSLMLIAIKRKEFVKYNGVDLVCSAWGGICLAILVILCAVALANNTFDQQIQVTGEYNELLKRAQSASVIPVGEDEADMDRFKIQEINKRIFRAQQQKNNFFVGVYLKRGLAELECIDYGLIKQRRNFEIHVPDMEQ